jgi:hypothetical protein
MLTTEDADAYHNVHPYGQVVGYCDLLGTCSIGAAVVGETPSRISGHAGSSRHFEAYSLSAEHAKLISFC